MERTAVTISAISTGNKTPLKNPNDVVFHVKYPEGYSGPRHMPEGPVTVSKESAEEFEKRGIGSIVDETKKAEGSVTVSKESAEESDAESVAADSTRDGNKNKKSNSRK